MESNLQKNNISIIGIDLSWGSKDKSVHTNEKGDGICVIAHELGVWKIKEFAYTFGDYEFFDFIKRKIYESQRLILMIDAPIVCPNRKGMRPVDKLTHRLFHLEHAACYPANFSKCSRPSRIRKQLEKMGFLTDWDLNLNSNLLIEVYPHPAMVRLFKLKKIFKYKKGCIAEKLVEFKKYQKTFKKFLANYFGDLTVDDHVAELLKSKWSKKTEDILDAFFCAVIGLWHYKHSGIKSEIIGDRETGFILLPIDLRKTN